MAIDEEYQRTVDLVADKDLDFDFRNSSTEHANYVISKMVEKTKNNLMIYSKNLANEVFDNNLVLESLKNNKNNINVRILLDDLDNKIAVKFKSYFSKIKVKKLKEISNDILFFVVSDGQRIRVCSRDKPPEARVNFNKKLVGSNFVETFETLWKPDFSSKII